MARSPPTKSRRLNNGTALCSPTSNVIKGGGEEPLWFYWHSIVEAPHQSGRLYLFGTLRTAPADQRTSCCIVVNGLEHALFIQPKPECTRVQVMEDVQTWLRGTVRAPRVRIRPTPKRTCAEESKCGTGRSHVMEVRFPATCRQAVLGPNFTLRTVQRAWLSPHTAAERFLLQHGMRGPGWLRISNPMEVSGGRRQSHCRREFHVQDTSHVRRASDNKEDGVSGPPPPTIATLVVAIHTTESSHITGIVIQGFSAMRTSDATVTGMAGATPDINECMWCPPLSQDATVEVVAGAHMRRLPNERALLSVFAAILARCDPDVVVGHGLQDTVLVTLLARMKELRVASWSQLGRLRRSHVPSRVEDVTVGRLVCDTRNSARQLVKANNYTLDQLLGGTSGAVALGGDGPPLARLCRTAQLTFQLLWKFAMLPLSHELAVLSGSPWSACLAGSRARRVEYMLLHEFHTHNLFPPSQVARAATTSQAGRRRRTFEGGLVLEPKRGLVDTLVLLMDFTALYPSIIQEFNLCFTTLQQGAPHGTTPDRSHLPAGVLPDVLRRLVEHRQAVKATIATARTPHARERLDVRQKALKILANSTYGCLGFHSSRFYSIDIAQAVTAWGRRLLRDTVATVENELQLQVLYGDTDSIMVDTACRHFARARAIGHIIQHAINSKYRRLRISMDGIFQRMLLVRKKKYAALPIVAPPGAGSPPRVLPLDIKGLFVVRRDWCALCREVGTRVLEMLLLPPGCATGSGSGSGSAPESVSQQPILAYLRTIAVRIHAAKEPLASFVLSKCLNKAPHKYPVQQVPPHVVVAKRLQRAGTSVHVQDVIPYVVCTSAAARRVPLAERAWHPSEVTPQHRVDVRWYLKQQVLPCMTRLCSVVFGSTIQDSIADALGVPRHAAPTRPIPSSALVPTPLTAQPGFYAKVEPFKLQCSRCGACEYWGPTATTAPAVSLQCPKCSGWYSAPQHAKSGADADADTATPPSAAACAETLSNAMMLALRGKVVDYMAAWVVCDQPSCGLRTRQQSTRDRGRKCLRPGCPGVLHREASHADLYAHLDFFASSLRASKSTPSSSEGPTALLAQTVSKFTQRSAYATVDMGALTHIYADIDPWTD